MARRHGQDLAVGVFAALALVVLSLAVMSVGTDSELFRDSVEYRVLFPDTGGLRVGSPVKISGVQVGSVRTISLPADPGVRGIEVTLGVDGSVADRVRTDSEARVRYLQLVSGEKYVEISSGSPDAPPLPPGTELPVAADPELYQQGVDIAEDLGEVASALRDILEPLRDGKGLLGELIQDPEFGKEGLEALRGTLENLQAITGDLRRGRGFVGRALTDPELARRVDDLSASLEALGSLAGSVARREGALGAMLEDGGAGETAIDDLAASAAALRRIALRLERPDGLVGRLLHDPEWSDSLAADVRETFRNTAEITRKINSGQGSLGALVNERVLYDGMEEVVAGVGDSKFARWLLRHYQKQGIELETESSQESTED